jgi:hypothetical protein
MRCEPTWCAGDPEDPDAYYCIEGGVCVGEAPCAVDDDCGPDEMCAAVRCEEGGPCEASLCVPL